MGAFEGSITFKTFFVDGEPPNDFHDQYLNRIDKFGFQPLTPESEEERSVGWVCSKLPLETHFTRDRLFHNQYIVFSMRIDRWSIPSTLLKAHLSEATREYLADNDVEHLGRREKESLKEMVTATLKRQLVPSMKVVDVVWNIQARTVRFWTHSKPVNEEFQELFEDTFELGLVPDSPYTAAMDLNLDDDTLEKLGNLTPRWFVEPHEGMIDEP